jgi:hypothetical protein
MPSFLEQPPGDHPDRLRSEALALEVGSEEQVDAGVAIVGIDFLRSLETAGDLATDLDRPDGCLRIVFQPIVENIDAGTRSTPPAGDARIVEKRTKRVAIARFDGPKGDTVAGEGGRRSRAGRLRSPAIALCLTSRPNVSH